MGQIFGLSQLATWILAITVLAVILGVIAVFSESGTGAIGYIKNIIRGGR